MSNVVALQNEIAAKREQLQKIFDSRKSGKRNGMGGDSFELSAGELGEVRDRVQELEDLEGHLEAARAYDRAFKQNREAEGGRLDRRFEAGIVEGAYDAKSLSEQFLQASNYVQQVNKKGISALLSNLDLKTLMSTSAGYAPANPRTNRVVFSAHRRPVVADYVPQDPTDVSVVKYMEETTFTNGVAAVAEGGTIPESALVFTERTAQVQKLAALLPVTEELLEDVAGVRSTIDNRLITQLLLTEENQILNGDGSSPNLLGFMNKSGVQTHAIGADSPQDAIFKGMTLVRYTGFAEPNAVIMNPNDWQSIRLATTSDGLYLWGASSEEGVDRIWGKPVIVTPVQTEGTALVGDFAMYSHISRKKGLRIDISDSHSTYFAEGKLAIRIEERLSLEIYRAAAFCKVTGI
jgi:HK97 family phage major capsid protein